MDGGNQKSRKFGPKSILLLKKNPNRRANFIVQIRCSTKIMILVIACNAIQCNVFVCLYALLCRLNGVYRVQIQIILSRSKGRSVLQFQNMQFIETVSFASNFSMQRLLCVRARQLAASCNTNQGE